MVDIAFTNDLHSHVVRGVSALDWLAGARDRNALVVDAGDFLGGSAFYGHTNGTVEREIAADLYDAIALGNHDAELLRPADHELFLSANVRRGRRRTFRPYATFERAGKRISVVSIMGAAAFQSIPAWARAGLDFVCEKQELDVVLGPLRAGSDSLLLLSHCGFEHDLELALRYPILDAILSSHCHSDRFVAHGGRVLVAKAPEHGEGIGLLTVGAPNRPRVEVRRMGRSARFTHPLLTKHNHTLATFENFAAEPIGRIEDKFAAAFPTRTDQVRQLARSILHVSRSSSCVLNLFALRSEFRSGCLSVGDLHDRLPFESALAIVPYDQLPSDWRRRVERSPEPLISVANTSSIQTSPTLCTTDYVAANILGCSLSDNWHRLGSLRSHVAAHAMVLFGTTRADGKEPSL